ncbi:MAG TPA: hypothetical protein VFU21_04355 [Kofleriaceae bacterium]|nr:hypothetical protein [Kofleriaceae bacterium]
MAKIRVPCSQETAAEFGDQGEQVHDHLLSLSDLAQTALGDWPDAASTGELRTLLLEVLEAAESGARRWQELARRFEALAVEGGHLHLLEGELIAVVDDADVVDTIDTVA